MSWSVYATGKVPAVRASVASQFAKNPCSEPEETIRQACGKAIDEALAGQDPDLAVKVESGGSQGFKDYTTKEGVFNSLRILVDPIHGFID